MDIKNYLTTYLFISFYYFSYFFIGGDVFVLQINNVTHSDTGLYVCEVNTEPPSRSFHRVTVLSDKLVAPKADMYVFLLLDTYYIEYF